MKDFEVSGGSVPGMDHIRPGQPGWSNNQDAFSFAADNEYLVTTICDGCSDAAQSEIGAQLISRFITSALYEVCLKEGGVPNDLETLFTNLKEKTLSFIDRLIRDLNPGEYRAEVLNKFLFTVLGVVMDEEITVTFSLGDGVFVRNEEVERIGPFPNNEPPYLGFCLLGKPQEFTFSVMPTKELSSLLVGSDGVADLIEIGEMKIPGKEEKVGDIKQFLEKKFVENPDAIRRRLALINRERAEGNYIKRGLLPDDTTIVVIRRIPQT